MDCEKITVSLPYYECAGPDAFYKLEYRPGITDMLCSILDRMEDARVLERCDVDKDAQRRYLAAVTGKDKLTSGTKLVLNHSVTKKDKCVQCYECGTKSEKGFYVGLSTPEGSTERMLCLECMDRHVALDATQFRPKYTTKEEALAHERTEHEELCPAL